MRTDNHRGQLLVLIVKAGCAIAWSAQTSDIRQIVADFFAALNSYNFGAYSAFYTPDASVVHYDNERTALDLTTAKGYREFEAATHARFSYQVHELTGNAADICEAESNDFYEILGPREHKSHWRYRFREGRIYEEDQLSPPDPEYLKAYRALRGWIASARPDDARKITMPDGNLIFSGTTAADILRLARAWKAEGGPMPGH